MALTTSDVPENMKPEKLPAPPEVSHPDQPQPQQPDSHPDTKPNKSYVDAGDTDALRPGIHPSDEDDKKKK